MAAVAPQQQMSSHSSRASPANVHNSDGSLPAAPPPPPSAAPVSRKNKGKKAGGNDATEAARQLQAKIAQLELDQAGRTEEDAEIGACLISILFCRPYPRVRPSFRL